MELTGNLTGLLLLTIVPILTAGTFIFRLLLKREVQRERGEILKRKNSYENFFETTNLIILMVDPKTSRIIHANPAAVNYYGYGAKELLKMSLEDLHFSGEGIIHQYLSRAAEDSHPFMTQHRLASGELRHMEVDAGFNGSRENSLLYIALHDETNRVNTEKELALEKEKAQKALKVKDEFLANISHELRTPLNGIVGMLNILENLDLNQEDREFLELAQDSTQNLYEIIRDLIDFNQLYSGKLDIMPEIFDLRAAINIALEFFARKAEIKGLTLRTDMELLHPCYNGDRNRLIQIIANLLSNAVKYTDSGEIVVSVQEESGLVIEVSDQGIGIPPDQIEEIFDSFHQLEDHYTKRFQGVGLGLSITKELVTLMQGTIEVKSQLEKGSRFIVKLPDKFCSNQGELIEKTDAEENESVKSETTVLVVEDDAINRIYISRLLKAKNIKVVEAVNGYQAIERCIETAPDIILMDISLPKLNGLDATREIRALERYRNLPIIALTAYSRQEEIAAFLKHGMTKVVTKPVQEAELMDAIKSIIDHRD